ncbi:hypothetical protein D3C86_966870 [compost metagenome]
MLAQLVFHPQHLIARGVGGHDEGRDTALAGVGVGDREDDHGLAALARRDELLGAVQDVVVAVAAGAGAQAAGVRTRLRLGQGKAADVLAACQRPQELLFLRVVAELQDGHAGDRIVHAHDGGACAATGRDFLQRHGVRHVAAVVAIPFLGHQHAEET